MFRSKSDLEYRVQLATAIAPIILANLPPSNNRTEGEAARAVADATGLIIVALMDELKKQAK
jgi:hypothetical protein